MPPKFKPFANRFALVLIIALVLVFGINEGAYWLIKDDADRAPKSVELVIPEGTSELVANGESTPSIPEEMIFVVGDTLVVDNQDSSAHQLGPIWVPANSRASLVLGEVSNFVYQCSFQPTKYMGIDVRTGTTIWSRFMALMLAGPPTAMFLFIYSLLVFPLDKKKTSTEKNQITTETRGSQRNSFVET